MIWSWKWLYWTLCLKNNMYNFVKDDDLFHAIQIVEIIFVSVELYIYRYELPSDDGYSNSKEISNVWVFKIFKLSLFIHNVVFDKVPCIRLYTISIFINKFFSEFKVVWLKQNYYSTFLSLLFWNSRIIKLDSYGNLYQTKLSYLILW